MWGGRIAALLAKLLMGHLHITTHSTLRRPPRSHRFGNLVDWWIWSCPRKCLSGHVRFHNQNGGSSSCSAPPAFHTRSKSLAKASLWLLANILWRGISSFLFKQGFSPQATHEVASNWGGDTVQPGEVCYSLDRAGGPGATRAVEWVTGRVDSCWVEDTEGGTFSRVDRGMFPRSRWKGITRTHRLWGAGP